MLIGRHKDEYGTEMAPGGSAETLNIEHYSNVRYYSLSKPYDGCIMPVDHIASVAGFQFAKVRQQSSLFPLSGAHVASKLQFAIAFWPHFATKVVTCRVEVV